MPERERAVTFLTEILYGGPLSWNGATGMVRPGQVRSFVSREAREVLTDDWDRNREEVDAAFERVVHCIDWTRVLLTAYALHNDKHPDPEYIYRDVCGECLMEALLTKDR